MAIAISNCCTKFQRNYGFNLQHLGDFFPIYFFKAYINMKRKIFYNSKRNVLYIPEKLTISEEHLSGTYEIRQFFSD